MSDHHSFQRFAAVTAIVSFPLTLASVVLSGIAQNFSPDMTANPALMLSIGVSGTNLLRWGMILDMLGYYLPLLPVTLFLQHWLRPRSPNWVRFFTICGLGYIFIGAIGAATLAAVQPALINLYAQASADQRYVLETIFSTIWNMVFGGMWNILDALLVGVWFLGIGWFLRTERRIFSIVSIILGTSALLDSLGMILNIEVIFLLGVSIYVLLAPFWVLWLGIDLVRKPVEID